jgi:hypothetical protein
MTPTILACWLDAGGAEDLADFKVDADALLQETRDWDVENRIRAHRLVDGFLDRVATRSDTLIWQRTAAPAAG